MAGTFVRLIRAWVGGQYRNIGWKSIVLAIAAVIYFANSSLFHLL